MCRTLLLSTIRICWHPLSILLMVCKPVMVSGCASSLRTLEVHCTRENHLIYHHRSVRCKRQNECERCQLFQYYPSECLSDSLSNSENNIEHFNSRTNSTRTNIVGQFSVPKSNYSCIIILNFHNIVQSTPFETE